MKWKRPVSILCAAALLLSMTACGTSAGGDGSAPAVSAAPDASPSSSAAAGSGTSSSPSAELPDDGYETEGAVTLTFTDSGISGSGSGFEADGTALTITDAGTYLLSGSCTDGSVKVKKGVTGVTLVLNGLTLTSADTAPITCAKSSGVTIVAAADTVNTLTDAAQNNDDEYPDNENAENAVIKCKDGSQVTLRGTGTLNLIANGKNGIKSGATTEEEGEAWLLIRDLTLKIDTAVNDGINAEQLLTIESGSITVSAADDGIHCDLTMYVGAEGTDGPDITISQCYEGLEAAELNIASGSIVIHASDDCLNAANSDLSGYAFALNISGGTLVMETTGGDGIDSNGSLTVTGGTVVVWTANMADSQPLDSDGTISITGGTVLAVGGSAGMGMNLAAGQAYVVFGSGSFGGPGGFAGGQSGLSIASGSAVEIRSAQGEVLYSGSALCQGSYLFFSSAELTSGESYALYVDGTSVSESTASTDAMSEGGMGGGPGGMGGWQPGAPSDGNGEPPSMPGGESGQDGQQPPSGGEGQPTPPSGGNGQPSAMPGRGNGQNGQQPPSGGQPGGTQAPSGGTGV